jgi:hypothetical protein
LDSLPLYLCVPVVPLAVLCPELVVRRHPDLRVIRVASDRHWAHAHLGPETGALARDIVELDNNEKRHVRRDTWHVPLTFPE